MEKENVRRHETDVSYYKLQQKCQDIVYQLIKTLYPWIEMPRNWEGILEVIKGDMPRLHYHAVLWELPQMGKMKCNMDGANRGNPGESAYNFCVRNHAGHLIYSEAKMIGIGTNMDVKISVYYRSNIALIM